MSFDGAGRDRAQALLVFCDGVEDAGHPELARRSRVVARDVLRLADELDRERSARRTVQAQRDECLQILANHAAQGMTKGGWS